MSLASRLVNLFTPNQIPHLDSTDGQSAVTIGTTAHNAVCDNKPAAGFRSPKMSRTMEEEELEERPPYLHVGSVLRMYLRLTYSLLLYSL